MPRPIRRRPRRKPATAPRPIWGTIGYTLLLAIVAGIALALAGAKN